MNRVLIRSMTGYGDAERDLELGRLRVEIRTVNHKYLNVRIRTPGGFDRHHGEMERILKGHISRGHAEVTVSLDREASGGSAPPVAVDVERARAYVDALRSLQDTLGLEGPLHVDTLVRFRDVFRDQEDEVPELPAAPVFELLAEAAERVVAMREEEGRRLAEDLAERLTRMEAALARVEARAPERLVAERDRLRAAIADLLDGQSPVDEDRLAREVAHMAERWDVHEEIVRFRSHLALFRDSLEAGDRAGVGKRFGFVAQELLREANTLGSKANDAEIAREVVGLKEEIDRLREQLENVE